MRGRDFLDVAEFLVALDTEASFRTQIGRIYYATYLEARQWCETHLAYQRLRLGREHSEIPALLSSLDSDITDYLAFLRTYRNTADYDMDISVSTLEAQLDNARSRALDIIARLDTLTPPASPGNDAE